MEFTKHVRKPFFVEAIKITNENIEELSEFIGTYRTKPNGAPYIQVDRRKVPNVFRVYPGFWMTRMGDHIRCYATRVFDEQFVETSDEIEAWVNFLNQEEEQLDEPKEALVE